jgi:feruloyl esterase
MKILASAALVALTAGLAAGVAAQTRGSRVAAEVFSSTVGPDRCVQVQASQFGANNATGTWVPAANGLPAFCEVKATLNPVPGSAIGTVYRLPENWNGKVLGLGGGGWAGNVTIQAASEGLKKGYATMSTDAGHVSTGNVWDATWASNPEAFKDFSYRGVHEMTVAGKKLVRAYYTRGHSKAYFQGCSTGGRMALMEAQRYPLDYDAISAGAPVYSWQVQTSAVLRNNAFAKNNGGFTAGDLKLAQSAAVKQCDAADGATDGLINNPRQCHFDPGVLQCSGAKNDSCLAPAQVAALRSVYEGTRGPDGQWAMLPMSRGGEPGWTAFVGTNGSGRDASYSALETLFPLAMGHPVTLTAFTPADVRTLRATAMGRMYDAADPNLRPFFAHGGKLLLWHGENDPGPSPVATADYARQVLAKGGSRAAQNMRLFLLPGVEHCGGGPGASPIPLLDTIDSWTATGRAPMSLVGAKADNSVVRLQCAWPEVAHYKGNGNVNNPANWSCTRGA